MVRSAGEGTERGGFEGVVERGRGAFFLSLSAFLPCFKLTTTKRPSLQPNFPPSLNAFLHSCSSLSLSRMHSPQPVLSFPPLASSSTTPPPWPTEDKPLEEVQKRVKKRGEKGPNTRNALKSGKSPKKEHEVEMMSRLGASRSPFLLFSRRKRMLTRRRMRSDGLEDGAAVDALHRRWVRSSSSFFPSFPHPTAPIKLTSSPHRHISPAPSPVLP